MGKKPRTIVALSGGVDSAVAAYLLKESGHEVAGLFMSKGKYSPAGDESLDARRAAEALGLPLEVVDLEAEFGELIGYFCREYNAGRTPNPCCVCNARLKFGKLLEYADRTGARSIATGHYARVEHRCERYLLLRGCDESKDQSYALFCLTQDQLARAIFPNGGMTKQQIRKIAADLDLPVKDRPESQEICFIPHDDYGRFLRENIPESIKPGPVKDLQGNVVGEHPGIQFFTIGQRRGVRIAFGEPMYVVRLEAETNTVIVGPNEALMKTELTVSSVNWIAAPPSEPIRVEAKIRYREQPVPAVVHPLPHDRARVVFDRPERAVTPGQAAVFYHGEVVAGGGWID